MIAPRPSLIVAIGLLACQGALAETCRKPAGTSGAARRARDCPPDERVQPYDPDRLKAGRTPGLIDLGNGTEVRIGGRVRMEYDTRR